MPNIADLVKRLQSTGEKLSSNQDFQLLDEMLTRSLQPLEAETEVYFEWLAEVAAFTITSRRRQNDTLVAACIAGLCGGENSARVVVASGIDRGHILSMLNKATHVGERLEKAQIEYMRRHGNRVNNAALQEIHHAKNILGNWHRVVPAMRTSAYWYRLALAHKSDIIHHYQRLLLKVASRINHASGGRVELESAFGDAYLAADTAANRFQPHKGVFATYINVCLKGSSRVSASNALGLAAPGARVLSADALQTDSIDAALDISDPITSAHMVDDSMVTRIDAIAGDKDVRAALMISEVVPPAVTQLLKSGGVKQRMQSMTGEWN